MNPCFLRLFPRPLRATAFAVPALHAVLAFLLFAPAAVSHAFEAGVGIADITPKEWPLRLRGSFNPQLSDQVHDPLSARAIAFRNSKDAGPGSRAIIVLVDNVGVNRETLDAYKEKAAAATGWKTSEMLIAATHSHSAPSMSDGPGPQGAYHQHAGEGIVAAIQAAIENLQPARACFGTDSVPDEVFNRRWYLEEGTMPPNPFGEIDQVKMNPPRNLITKPAGPTDPTVAVLDIRNARNKPLGLLANYPLHYVGAVPRNHVSADYFGEFARLMTHRLRAPEGFLAILSNGTSGDINNIDFTGTRAPRAPFEQIRQVASKVADAAWRATRELDPQPDLEVAMLQREVTLNYRKPSPEEVERARKILAMNEEELKKLPRLANHYAARTLSRADRPDTVDVIIQAIRIGDHAIVSLPFEVLVEIGLDIKKKSPFPGTMIIELANGSYGYLPNPKQHALGGYETWPGTSNVQIDASEILTRELLEMLEKF